MTEYMVKGVAVTLFQQLRFVSVTMAALSGATLTF